MVLYGMVCRWTGSPFIIDGFAESVCPTCYGPQHPRQEAGQICVGNAIDFGSEVSGLVSHLMAIAIMSQVQLFCVKKEMLCSADIVSTISSTLLHARHETLNVHRAGCWSPRSN